MDWKALCQCRLRLVDKLVVQANIQLVVLSPDAIGGCIRSHKESGLKHSRKIQVASLRGAKRLVHAEQIRTTNHLVDGANAELGHYSTEFFGEIVEEVDHLLGLPRELGTQLGILGSDTNGARVLDNISS